MTVMDAPTKISISQVAAKLDAPFSMLNVALVGDIVVSVYICQGVLQQHSHVDIDELFWVHDGTVLLESEAGEVELGPGELAVVPKAVSYTHLRAHET